MYICVRECNLLGSVSSQEKFEARGVKALGVSQLSDETMCSSWTIKCYSSVLQLNFIENNRKIHQHEALTTQRQQEESLGLAPLFAYFSPPWACPVKSGCGVCSA